MFSDKVLFNETLNQIIINNTVRQNTDFVDKLRSLNNLNHFKFHFSIFGSRL